MNLELLTPETLLSISSSMALGGIIGNAASDGIRQLAKQLWQTIKARLLQNQPTIEAKIVEFEQNPTQENSKFLEAFLQVEMHKDQAFAEAISNLGKEISQANGDNITIEGDIKAEGNAVAAAKIYAPNSRIGGSDTNINVGKD